MSKAKFPIVLAAFLFWNCPLFCERNVVQPGRNMEVGKAGSMNKPEFSARPFGFLMDAFQGDCSLQRNSCT